MFKATKEIYEALIAAGLKAYAGEKNGYSEVEVNFPLSCSAPVQIRFISADDDNDVAVRVDLMRVEEDKAEAILPVLNGFNIKYRYAKFTLNAENDVFVEYDLPIKGDHVGECAKEMVARLVKIIRQAHPELLRAVLAEAQQEKAPAGMLC
ncbi:MAG: YbjN domain-containing protein [Clostridia bacterium]|nr:YbjN domain-containing protein [Clostridia bacterium]